MLKEGFSEVKLLCRAPAGLPRGEGGRAERQRMKRVLQAEGIVHTKALGEKLVCWRRLGQRARRGELWEVRSERQAEWGADQAGPDAG